MKVYEKARMANSELLQNKAKELEKELETLQQLENNENTALANLQ